MWIRGYARSIGYASSIVAEFWALRDGLKMALNEGIQRLIVELDAKVVVDLIKTNAATNKPYAPLLYDCMYLLTRFNQAQVVHVYREGNCCADALAKWAVTCWKGLLFLIGHQMIIFCIYLVGIRMAWL